MAILMRFADFVSWREAIRRRPRFAASLLVAVTFLGVAAAKAADQPSATANWQTGPAFGKQLLQPVSLTWAATPIDASLQRLSEATHVAILLDRRVDPSRPLQFSADQLPLRQLLEKVAEQLDLGETTLDSVVYLGPTAVARQFRTLSSMQHALANRLSNTRKKAILERRRWSWERFTTPQTLLADLEREGNVKISGQERVPHDLLRAADLPPLPWVDRLLLLAAEFNLRAEIAADGAEVRLLPMVDSATITRAYPSKGPASEQAAKWRGLAPEADIKVDGDRVVVTGRVEDHELIGHGGQLPGAGEPSDVPKPTATAAADSSNGGKRPAPDRAAKRAPDKTPQAGKQVYQLAVEKKPLRHLLEQLAEKLDLELEFDEPAIKAAGRSVDELVSFKVKDASLDELLKAAASPAGLACERKDKHIKVVPIAK